MTGPYRVRVLSSYIYDRGDGPHAGMGKQNRWFHGFVSTLVTAGSGLRAFAIEFIRLPRAPAEVRAVAEALERDGVQLVICAGTDAAVRWAEARSRIPMLYFGAHAENNGLEMLDAPNVSGVRLHLPLLWSFRTFSLLTAVMPALTDLYVPINFQSEFCFPNLRALYRTARAAGRGAWIDGEDMYVGHRSVHFLAERAGVRYHEGPYGSLDELGSALAAVAPRTGAIAVFNDTLLLPGTVELVLGEVRARSLALFWVNNWPIVCAGGVADFSSDFERVGKKLGELALSVLRDGVPIDRLPWQPDPGERLGLNLDRCRELGLAVSDDVIARFDAVQRTESGARG